MKDIKLEGVVTAIVTPFKEDESLDLDAIQAYTDLVVSEPGVNGLLTCGYSGEGYSLTGEEQISVVKAVSEAAGGRVPIITSIFPTSTRNTIELGEKLKAAGADVLQVNSPFYNQLRRGFFRDESIAVKFFSDLADALDMPMTVFQYSDISGLKWPASTIGRLAEIPHVIGIKEASQMETYEADYRAVNGKTALFADNNTYTLIGMLLYGTAGSMVGIGQVCLPLWVKLYELTSTGRFNEAIAHANEKIVPLINTFSADLGNTTFSFTGRLKEALVQLGRIPNNTVRLPEPPVTEADKVLVRSTLLAVGALD